ncbi:MAG: 2,3-bisphosphoglycerate-independent phosphoglycerate mutase [Nitrospiraceae bacterium]|nr:2,3-bisphosphoglycerate-independent phosphoglycerate mutase [Nitrospiraceae bacterium]
MQNTIKHLIQKNNSKIILVVLDGLGGLPMHGKTELETADIPNLDMIAQNSACGMHLPVGYGITPGSGPGHLALFGYDPVEWQIGRGVLEALGLGVELKKTDIAIRGNYSTIKNGIIKDRRAGRIPTEKNKDITGLLQNKIKKIGDVEVIFTSGMEHRFSIVLRFPDSLEKGSGVILDTDPQKEEKAPLDPVPETKQAEKIIPVVKNLISQIEDILKKQDKANFALLRGFSQAPDIPHFNEVYGLKSLAIASYPMYRGLAKLIGMDAPEIKGDVETEIEIVKQKYKDYDFFFVHVKKIDSYGEDGNFVEKANQLANFDSMLPQILALNPDVLIITGDHSTPSLLKGHSWHPVPVLLKSPYVFGNTCRSFTERECLKGEFGIFNTVNLMPLALANALRLKKFGA